MIIDYHEAALKWAASRRSSCDRASGSSTDDATDDDDDDYQYIATSLDCACCPAQVAPPVRQGYSEALQRTNKTSRLLDNHLDPIDAGQSF